MDLPSNRAGEEIPNAFNYFIFVGKIFNGKRVQ